MTAVATAGIALVVEVALRVVLLPEAIAVEWTPAAVVAAILTSVDFDDVLLAVDTDDEDVFELEDFGLATAVDVEVLEVAFEVEVVCLTELVELG